MSVAKQGSPRSFSFFALVPALILASAGAWLLANWSAVPARWAVHYDVHGTPDAWVERSVGLGLAPLLIGAFLWILLEVVAVASARATAEREHHEPLAVAGLRFARLISVAIAILCAALAVNLPFSQGLGLWFALPFAGVFVAAGIGIVSMQRAVREVRQKSPDALRGYNALYYYDREDERLWVPKIAGVGWTINFAHPRARLTLGLLLVVPLTSAIIGVVAAVVASR